MSHLAEGTFSAFYTQTRIGLHVSVCFAGRPSDTQKHVELPGLEHEACNSVYAVANVTLSDKQLCIGGLNGSDSCRGDSGGPLMREVRGGWFLIGVVSFGARFCGTQNLPGVYTNVAKYLDWMETVMFVERYL